MYARLLAAGLALAPLAAQATCGAAFCMIDTHWSLHGADSTPGLRADLRFEYVDQDQPRSGTRDVAVGELPRHHDEVRTINRNWIATLDYVFSASWALTATLPLVDRYHQHIHNHRGARLDERWDFAEAGDLKLQGRWQSAPVQTGGQSLGHYGFTFGAKLPTGSFKVRNGENALAERSLQPGTGTTDALLGAYWTEAMPAKDLSWFAQALAQVPLNKREEYEPGERAGFDVGLRYDAAQKVGLLLQANFLYKGKDSGLQAEPVDSGGKFLWLSPGIAWSPAKDWQLYGFIQLPLYQDVNGVQLVAERAFVVGASVRF